MAIIYSYPQVKPKPSDLLIGTVTYDATGENPVDGNPTRTFSVQDVANLVASYELTTKQSGTNAVLQLKNDTGGLSAVNLIRGNGISLNSNGSNSITIGNLGVLSANASNTNFINMTPTAASTGNVTFSASLSASGSASALTYLRGDNKWATPVTTISTASTTFIDLTPISALNGDVLITAALSATGTQSNQTFLRGDNTWAVPENSGGTMSQWNLELTGPNFFPVYSTITNDDNIRISSESDEIVMSMLVDPPTYDGTSITWNLDLSRTGASLGVQSASDFIMFARPELSGNPELLNGQYKVLPSNISLSAFGAPIADLNVGTNKLTNVVDPVSPQDAATKNYVDNSVAYTAGTGIDVTNNIITNTAPDQTVVITGSGNATVTGTYPNFNVDVSSLPISSDSNFVFIDVKNETGVEIPLGTGCMAVGTDGNSGHVLVAPMIADGSVEPKYYIGVLEETIQNGEFGRVVTQGEVNQINTNAFLDGDVLWCDPTNPGGFTKTEPVAPAAKLATAIVLNSSTNGKIFVRVQGNEGLHELHDVNVPEAALQNDDVLYWDAINGYWSHKQISVGSGAEGSIPIWNADGTLGQSGFTQFGASVVFSQPGNANYLMLDSQGSGSHIMLDGFGLASVDPINGVMIVANGALVKEFNSSITSIANSYLSIDPAADRLTINSTTGAGQILISQGELSVPNTVTASSFITTGGTSDAFVKGDGSLDTSTYISNITATSPDNSILFEAPPAGYNLSARLPAIPNLDAGTYTNANVTVNQQGIIVGIEDGTGGGGGITSVQPGTNITIDNTDPANPIINASAGSGNAAQLSDLSDVQTFGYQSYALLPGAGINATSSQATILGYNAAPNTTGTGTTAFGNGTLFSLTTGASNTAIGRGSQYTVTTGSFNTSVGESAIILHNGDYNVVMGYRAMRKETGTQLASSDNVILGAYATSTASSGLTGNVVIGAYANSITGGSDNIRIGNERFTTPVYSIGTGSHKISLGSNQVDGAYVNVAWTVVSDERDKMDFNPVPAGLDFVNKLEPISYYRRKERGKEERAGFKKYGFKAQDILALEGSDPVIVDASNEDQLMYTESNLIPVLVNAIKELTNKVNELELKINK